jgi:hypothetical protein
MLQLILQPTPKQTTLQTQGKTQEPNLHQCKLTTLKARRCIRDEVEIARRANYDRDQGVPDALDAHNPIQAIDLWNMHDQELLRRAQYEQDNGPLDDLYIILTVYAPSASPGAVNNFPAFS